MPLGDQPPYWTTPQVMYPPAWQVPPTVVQHHHYFHSPCDHTPILEILRTILTKLDTQESKIMADLTAITAAVTNNTTVEDSAIALINGLAAQIAAAGTDPAALASLTDSLTTESASLAAAVAANTPTAPQTPPLSS